LREKKPLTTEMPDVVQDVNVARNIFIFYLKFSVFFLILSLHCKMLCPSEVNSIEASNLYL
jgi:hypothetical protein